MVKFELKRLLRACAIAAVLIPISSGSYAAMQDESADDEVIHEMKLVIKTEEESDISHEIEQRIDEARSRINESSDARHELNQARTELNLIVRELESELGAELGDLDADELSQFIIERSDDLEIEFTKPVEPSVMLIGVVDQGYLNEWLTNKHRVQSRDSSFERLTPIIAILAVFGTPVLIVGLVTYFRAQRRKAAVKAVAEIVARNPTMDGDTIDEIRAALAGDTKTREKQKLIGQRDLRKGAILTAIGSAVSLAFIFDGNWGSLWFGLVILFAGLAFLWLHHKNPKLDSDS